MCKAQLSFRHLDLVWRHYDVSEAWSCYKAMPLQRKLRLLQKTEHTGYSDTVDDSSETSNVSIILRTANATVLYGRCCCCRYIRKGPSSPYTLVMIPRKWFSNFQMKLSWWLFDDLAYLISSLMSQAKMVLRTWSLMHARDWKLEAEFYSHQWRSPRIGFRPEWGQRWDHGSSFVYCMYYCW